MKRPDLKPREAGVDRSDCPAWRTSLRDRLRERHERFHERLDDRMRERHLRWHRRWQQRLHYSLRWRLISVFLVLALAMGAVFIGGVQRALSSGWRDAAQPLVSDYMDRLVTEIGAPPDVARAEALVARLPITLRIDGPSVQWASHPGRDAEAPWARRNSEWLTRTTADGHRITFGIGPMPWEAGHGGPHGYGWAGLAALMALLVLAYAYVRRLLRPLDEIGAGAERFGRGVFDHPIPVRRSDELGDLAGRINTMAHDIEGMLDAKRALLLALSHELRSPLTRARINAELLPTTVGGDGPGEAERAALLRDLGEMRELITDLLESERLAGPHAALQREPVDLAALVRETVAAMEAARADVAIDLDLDRAPGLPPLALDRTRMRLLLRNLLDNARRYGAAAGRPPQVVLTREAGGVRLAVRDFGHGVDADQLARLTEPFYRTDSARQRATGGFGLGMYLCRLIAEAHGSELRLCNADPGLEVSLLLTPPDIPKKPDFKFC